MPEPKREASNAGGWFIPATRFQGGTMKKIVFLLVVALIAVAGYAVDTMIAGFNAETGIGTYKVMSDGTDCTLTVDKLVVSDASTLPGGYVSNVVAQTASVAGTVVLSYTTNILTYLDGDTNAVSWTNIAVSGVAVTTAGVTTNITVTRK
jgi:hypothetical protein